MKKLDSLLIRSFIPPFILTFFIALFVLIMQFLWKYIDDIVGKGLELIYIVELIFYRSTALIPMALPVAILISAVMVMGNLAELFELASLKSAGIALIRIMRPLLIVVTFISIGSYLASNYLIPYSNLKFKSRLYDIRRQKPALSLDEGGFNHDFGGTVIRITEKADDNRTLNDVMIYDHSDNRGNVSQILAKKGEMFTTSDQRYLIMRLFNGQQYQELKPSSNEKQHNYEHFHTSFGEWEKIFDLREFDLKETDEKLFKSHQSMLSHRQLIVALDSLHVRKENRMDQLHTHVRPYFYHERISVDSVKKTSRPVIEKDSFVQEPEKFEDLVERSKLPFNYQKATTLARNVKNYTAAITADVPRMDRAIVEHQIEIHRKYALAFACFIFLFIGAPMGAIVRKGGFGWPILIAIIFFVFFIMMTIVGEKLAKEFVVSPMIGMWLSCIVLFPIGVFLTHKAMRDSKALNIDTYIAFLKNLLNIPS